MNNATILSFDMQIKDTGVVHPLMMYELRAASDTAKVTLWPTIIDRLEDHTNLIAEMEEDWVTPEDYDEQKELVECYESAHNHLDLEVRRAMMSMENALADMDETIGDGPKTETYRKIDGWLTDLKEAADEAERMSS